VKEKLKNLQKIFIEAKDWEEVSRIQYELDSLSTPQKEQKIEPWFQLILLKKILEIIMYFIAMDIYMMKILEKVGDDDVVGK